MVFYFYFTLYYGYLPVMNGYIEILMCECETVYFIMPLQLDIWNPSLFWLS